MSDVIHRIFQAQGLDLHSTDLTRDDSFFSDMRNAQPVAGKNSLWEKRKGQHAVSFEAGGFGNAVYNKVDENGVLTPELLAVGTNLERMEKVTLTVSYSGANPVATVTICYVTDRWRCRVVEGASTLLDSDLGTGFEGSPKTITTLRGEIDALANFAATVTGDGTVAAAFLDAADAWDLTQDNLASEARDVVEVNKTLTTVFPSFVVPHAKTLEHASTVNNSNLLYIASRDGLFKYDSQTVYRAGLPKTLGPSGTISGAGSLTTGQYIWLQRHVHNDKVENIIDGPKSSSDLTLNATAGSRASLSLRNVIAGSGYQTDCAIVNGAGQSVPGTVTVDNGSGGSHTIKVGDRVAMERAAALPFVSFGTVTATTATTITISSNASFTLADNSIISAGLVIELYRTLVGGGQFGPKFLVATYPNDSFNTTQARFDGLADASVGAELIDPDKPITTPPVGRYVTVLNNQLFLSGELTNPNVLYWEDPLNTESFPITDNALLLRSEKPSAHAGIAGFKDTLYTFEDRAIHATRGDFIENILQSEVIKEDLGCEAHSSIDFVGDSLYFLSHLGPWRIFSPQQSDHVGLAVEPLFDTTAKTLQERLNTKRAVGRVDTENHRYVLFIPTTKLFSTEIYSSVQTVLVHDYRKNRWLRWDTINMDGGLTFFDKNLYFTERRLSSGVVVNRMYRFSVSGSRCDYVDHNAAISMILKTNWFSFELPSIKKKVVDFGIHSTDAGKFNTFTLEIEQEANFIETLISDGIAMSFDGTVTHREIAAATDGLKATRFTIKNEVLLENPRISGIEVEANVPYRREVRV